MKKYLKFISAGLVIGLLSTSTVFASAETFKSIWDYNSLPAGFQPGSSTDKGSKGSPYVAFNKGLGTIFDASVQSGVGINGGNGLVVTCKGEEGNADWISWDTYTDKAVHPVTDVEGATDFVVWFDTTHWKYKDPAYDYNGAKLDETFYYYFDIGEYDYNSSGKLTGNMTTWEPRPNAPCYFQNGNGWTKSAISPEDKDKAVPIPKNFKGWIRVPLSSLQKAYFGNYDADNKWDGKHIVFIGCGMGFWKDNNVSSFTIANYGFLGDFKSGGIPLPLDVQKSSSNASSSKSNGTGIVKTSSLNAVSSGAQSLASILSGNSVQSLSASSSSSSLAISSSESSSDLASESSNTNTATAAAKQSHASAKGWVIAAIVIGVLLIGAVVFYLLRIRKLRRR